MVILTVWVSHSDVTHIMMQTCIYTVLLSSELKIHLSATASKVIQHCGHCVTKSLQWGCNNCKVRWSVVFWLLLYLGIFGWKKLVRPHGAGYDINLDLHNHDSWHQAVHSVIASTVCVAEWHVVNSCHACLHMSVQWILVACTAECSTGQLSVFTVSALR